MDLFQMIFLGVVQGLTEFLPVSSSAHLLLLPKMLGWGDVSGDLILSVAVHIGTMVAVVAYFWRDWITMISDGLSGKKTSYGRMFWLLVFATIPAGIIGLVFEEKITDVFRHYLYLSAGLLMLMGVILYWVDIHGRKRQPMEKINLGQSLVIGLSQAVALFPGVSRSGATITTGLLLGLTREAAARFSFYLSTPVIVLGGLWEMKGLIGHKSEVAPSLLLVGAIVSGLVGYLAIKFMLALLKNGSYKVFAWYRLAFGALVVLTLIARGVGWYS